MKTPTMKMRNCDGHPPKWVAGQGITRTEVCGKRFRPTHADQTECPKCGGGMKLQINPDQTVSALWTGPANRGSLLKMAMQSNAEKVNRLDAIQLFAVLMSVKECPFPLGSGDKVYAATLSHYRANPPDLLNRALSLGEFRHAMVVKAGEGFNAPTDSYLSIAVDAIDAAEGLEEACMYMGNFAQCIGNVGDFLDRQQTLRF